MFLRKPRIDVTLMQPMKASTMYCTASTALTKTGSYMCVWVLGVVNTVQSVYKLWGIMEPYIITVRHKQW